MSEAANCGHTVLVFDCIIKDGEYDWMYKCQSCEYKVIVDSPWSPNKVPYQSPLINGEEKKNK